MRLSLIVLGVIVVLAAIFAVPVDMMYAKRQATPVDCKVTEFIPADKGRYDTFKLDCEGQIVYRHAFLNEYALAKVGDEHACWRWRHRIQIPLIDDGNDSIGNCSRK